MDEDHLLTAARYVELNPVRQIGPGARPLSLEQRGGSPERRDDALVQVVPLLQMAPNWRRLLTVLRYIERNAGGAGLVARAEH